MTDTPCASRGAFVMPREQSGAGFPWSVVLSEQGKFSGFTSPCEENARPLHACARMRGKKYMGKGRGEMRLEGKVALISGGALGMGAAEARLFAREGARVVIGDVLEAEGHAVEADVRANGGAAVVTRLDVTSETDWEQAVDRALRRSGMPNVLINNAG